MFIVVRYDIPHDRRRTRLHRTLKNFGTRVQYSVFECVLDPKDFSRLQAAVQRVITAGDHVRYYRMPEMHPPRFPQQQRGQRGWKCSTLLAREMRQ
jgi:CRISPR-associated protein Cas2